MTQSIPQTLPEAPRWQVGTWTLTAPDGRTWQADSPLKCCSAEQRERVPPEVALKRIFDALDEPAGAADDFNGDDAALCRSIEALLALDAAKALVPHGVGGHARGLLSAAAARLSRGAK